MEYMDNKDKVVFDSMIFDNWADNEFYRNLGLLIVGPIDRGLLIVGLSILLLSIVGIFL